MYIDLIKTRVIEKTVICQYRLLNIETHYLDEKKIALLPVSIRKLGDFISKNNQIKKESNNC